MYIFQCNTWAKIYTKIHLIKEYNEIYKKYSKVVDSSDAGNFRSLVHHAIYVQYRSLFKEIEGGKLEIKNFTQDDIIINIHNAIMTITDKDVCHNDKKSKTFKLTSEDSLRENGYSSIMQSFLSDKELNDIIIFLPTILDKIEMRDKEKNQ